MTIRAAARGGVLLSVLLCLPIPAHAGFGSRSSGRSSGGGGSSSGRSSSRTSAPSASGGGSSRGSSSGGSVHTRAVPVYPRSSGSSGGYWRGGGRSSFSYRPYGLGFYPSSTLIIAPAYVGGPSDTYVSSYDQPDPFAPLPPRVELGADGTFSRGAGLLGVNGMIEGERFGFGFGYTGIFMPSPDDASATNSIHLVHAHGSYALVALPRARLRAEFGAHMAIAPDITFFAPGGGFSGAITLFGPIGLEAQIFATAWPYTELDTRAGLTVSSQIVAFHVGYRALYLNDNGALGSANAGSSSDFFRGPYVGLAIVL